MGEEVAVVLEPPRPKSPPRYPDLCGRRRLQLELQILNREIDFLKDELQSLEGVPPVSRSCKEVNEFVGTKQDPLLPIQKKRHRSCRLFGGSDQKCAYAHHGSAAPASACPSARDRVASIVLAVHALARSPAVGWPTAPVVTRVANLIAHPAVQAAARAATAICHAANQTVARVATRHAASQTAALVPTCHAANQTAVHAVNQAAAASSFPHAASSSAAQAAAPAPCRAAPAAIPVAVARVAAHAPATASQAVAVSARNAAAARNAAPALSAPASVASGPLSGRTYLGAAAPASNASSASRRAARGRRRAASASLRAVREKTAAGAAGGRAAVFQSRRAPGARAGAFGRAGSVQKGVNALDAGIRAVPPDACVEVELDVFIVVSFSFLVPVRWPLVSFVTLIYGVLLFL